MRIDRRWLLAPPLLAVLLASGPFAVDGAPRPTLTLALAGLAILLALATAALTWRSRPRPAPAGPVDPELSVRRTIPVAGGGQLLLVHFDDRDLLVAAGKDGGIRLLAAGERRSAAPARAARPPSAARAPEPLVELPRPARAASAERLASFRALARSQD
jgi:hypothetical protein